MIAARRRSTAPAGAAHGALSLLNWRGQDFTMTVRSLPWLALAMLCMVAASAALAEPQRQTPRERSPPTLPPSFIQV